jgi:thioredoxin reductase (NADPH)
MLEIYDLAIIGGGPAGLSAAIYGSRARLKTVVIEKGRTGGQAATTEEIENYPGIFERTTGPVLMDRFAAHAKQFGTEIIKGQAVDLLLDGPIKTVALKSGEEIQARAVILAPGAEPRTLGIKGERRLRGKGVSYCATCDADFFEDLDVAVIGNGDSAIEEAMYLTKFANEVTVVVLHDEGILDCNKASAEKAFQNPKLKFLWHSTLEQIAGDELVEKIIVKDIKTGNLSEKCVNGVFFFVGTVPKTEFLQGKVTLNEQGYIPTTELMETDIPGVYAVGDARVKYLRQVVTAASDGAVAAVAAEKYLAEMEFLQEQVLNTKGLVLLAFWAPQSAESVTALSLFEKAAEAHAVTLRKVDTYRNLKIAALYNVTKIPTVLVFKDGQITGRLDGVFNEADVTALI